MSTSERTGLSGRGRRAAAVRGSGFREKLARRIRTRRLELQMRAEDAADAVAKVMGRNVNVQTWYHWETAAHPFDVDFLPAIAGVLGMTVTELVSESGD